MISCLHWHSDNDENPDLPQAPPPEDDRLQVFRDIWSVRQCPPQTMQFYGNDIRALHCLDFAEQHITNIIQDCAVQHIYYTRWF